MRVPAIFSVLLLLFPVPSVRADWEVKRSPFDPALVASYKKQLHNDPEDLGTLKRLVALYRRYRSVDQLTREYSALAERSHDVADQLVLGNLARERNDRAEAARCHQAAILLAPSDARALAALAEDELLLGRAEEARTHYRAALEATRERQKRERLLRALADLAFAPSRGLGAEQAITEARPYFTELIDDHPHDEDTRRAWAELLAGHGQPKAAALEWRKLIDGLARDPARQTEGWLRVGDLELAADDLPAALSAYQKAYRMAPRTSYLRRAAIDKTIEVNRRKDDLMALSRTWEAEWRESERGFLEWETLARLYDEEGDATRAAQDFRRALALDGHALEARRRLIALLEREGEEAEVIAEYRKLVQAAPGEPRFRLELAERLWKTPDGAHEALELAARVGTETRDPGVHASLAELYTRWGRAPLALSEREKLVHLEPNEESHLVNLGELYYERHQKQKAIDTWRRLLTLGDHLPGCDHNRAHCAALAMAHLAEVYADHELSGESLELFEKAVKISPTDLGLKKGLAGALERMHRDSEAEGLWVELLDTALSHKDRPLALEVRHRLLALLSQKGRLAYRVNQFVDRFSDELKRCLPGHSACDPVRLAGYGLAAADGLLKLGRLREAEELLTRLAEKASDPETKADAYVGLAQLYRARHLPKSVIAALTKAAELAPSRARELYAQIAELSLELYRDTDALSFAKKAVELGPADAPAQLKLGEVLEKRDRLSDAISAYRRALELDPRQWKVHFTLARLYIRTGQNAQAAQLYREVIRRAPEEELVVDAARRALDLEEFLGTLADLEHELGPLAYAHPDRRVYRELLLELYTRYATPLIERAHRYDLAAEKELARLGDRALRPLLDLLIDGSPTEQRTAALLLGELSNPAAITPLLKLALGPRRVVKKETPAAPPPPALGMNAWAGVIGGVSGPPASSSGAIDLRVDAALGAARLAHLATPAAMSLLVALAASPEKNLRAAALIGLQRIDRPESRAALFHALDDSSPDLQMLACIGLGRTGPDHRALVEMIRRLGDHSGPARPERARAACAVGLGLARSATGADLELVTGALLDAFEKGEIFSAAKRMPRSASRMAAWALGRRGNPRAIPALLHAVITKPDPLREVAVDALAQLSHPASSSPLPPFPRGSDGVDLNAWLAALTANLTREAPASVWRGQLEAVEQAFAEALAQGHEVALRALDDLTGREEGLGLGPLLGGALEDIDRSALSDLGARLLEPLSSLLHDPNAGVRVRAVRALRLIDKSRDASRPELSIAPLLIELTRDPAPEVRQEVLASLTIVAAHTPSARPALADALLRALDAESWAERESAIRAVQGAGYLLEIPALMKALTHALTDPNGFVRQAAREVLGRSDGPTSPRTDG